MLALLLTVIMGLQAGCSPRPGSLESSGKEVQIPGRSLPLTDASFATVQGQWSRVLSEMPLTILATHWSKLSITREPADERHVAPSDPVLIKAKALMTNGSEVDIYCWPSSDGKIAVAVRAGPFGNPQAEALFIQNLEENLRKAPLARRGLKFDPPTLEEYQQADKPKYNQ